MNRRRPATATLAASASLVIAALIALVVLPLVIMRATQQYRLRNELHAEPARAALNEINYRLAQQASALARAAATHDPHDAAAYRRSIAPQNAAMRDLVRHAGTLGHEFDARLRELQGQIDRWQSSIRGNVETHRLATGSDYPAVIEAVHRLDDAITGFQSTQRLEVARLARIQLWSSVALVLIAAIAAAVVLWIVARFRTLITELEDESRARQLALDQQEQLVRLRDEILGVVSHDLRSPLTTIALSAQLLPGSAADEQSEHVGTILSTTRRMERLIQDLLDVSRIENSSLTVKKEPVDPGGLAREVVVSHQPIAAKQRIEFRSDVAQALPPICADRDRIIQALSNLLGNAFKFTPPEGVVKLAVQQRNGYVRFVVSDSGPGIAPSELPHLFEPFWQSKKTAHLGAGLGLKITRAVVEAHDGSVEVANRPAGGARFAFQIPVLEDEPPAEAASPAGGSEESA